MTDPVRVCYDCEREYDGPRARCACGEPLWFAVRPFEERPAHVRGGDGATGDGVWRYQTALPLETPSTDLGAGDTPLERVDRLDEYAGARVWLKNEGENPTGSFKDRGSAVGVAASVTEGVSRVGTVSHGNMALSTAAHAAAFGVDCVVLVPDDISETRLRAIGRFDPRIIRVRGDYGRLYHDALELGPKTDTRFVNSDTPLRVAGQKTLAFELLEGRPDLDAIVLPVSSGGNASAVWKGLLEMRAGGMFDALPRVYLVQAARCDPIATAFRRGKRAVEPASNPEETVAYSIANADPPSGTRALAAVRDTGGAVVSVPDEEILEARRRLEAASEVRAEPAAATPLAGLRRLTSEGEIGVDERVACVVTGRGYDSEREEVGGGEEVALSNVDRIDRADLEDALSESL